MIEAVSNLALIAIGVVVMVIWIAALANSDGQCPMENCDNCMFFADCPERRRRKNEDSNTESNPGK